MVVTFIASVNYVKSTGIIRACASGMKMERGGTIYERHYLVLTVRLEALLVFQLMGRHKFCL